MKLDMAALTLGNLEDASEMLGYSVSDALTGPKREAAIVALAAVVMGLSRDEARAIRFSELEVVNADPEVPARGNGNEPQPSRVSGGSIPPT